MLKLPNQKNSNPEKKCIIIDNQESTPMFIFCHVAFKKTNGIVLTFI